MKIGIRGKIIIGIITTMTRVMIGDTTGKTVTEGEGASCPRENLQGVEEVSWHQKWQYKWFSIWQNL